MTDQASVVTVGPVDETDDRNVTSAAVVIAAFDDAPSVDLEGLRADLDGVVDQAIEPPV